MSKKYRVALLIDEFFGGADTPFGGYGFLARNYIAKYLPDDDFSVDVLLFMDKEVKKVTAVKVDDVDVYKFPDNDKAVKKFLKKKDYDIFLSIELTKPSSEILKFVDDKRLILWIQDPRPQASWKNIIETMSSIKDHSFYWQPAYDLVRSWTEAGKVKYISQGYSLNPLAQELYDFPKETPIQYLPNPIEIDFDFKLKREAKSNKIIFLGRLEAQKRTWIFCEIAKKMPEYEFYVLGRFLRFEDENRKMLESYLQEDIPNLHFMGHVDGEEKIELIKEAKILLNTSIWEGIPISWLECLSYGTLTVSCLDNETLPSRFGCFVGEILGDGTGQSDKFIPAIRELIENEDEYMDKAQKAIEYIRQTHSIDKFRKDLRQVLIEECSKPKIILPKEKLSIRIKKFFSGLFTIKHKTESTYKILLFNIPLLRVRVNAKTKRFYFCGIKIFSKALS